MTQEAVQTPEAPPPEPGPVVRMLQEILPGAGFDVTPTPIDETITIRRDDFVQVMDTLAVDERLKFDYLRCLSGVDWLTELESVYHFYSFTHRHTLAVKVRCPYEDPHVPTVSHLWATANWHERETHEMFGIVFDGHPDLRPLLTEEGLGYYILRKSHPLAEIEEWQEDLLQAVEDAKQTVAAATGVAPVVDEKAMKIQIAQQKAAIIKKTRDEARAKGLSSEDEKAAVQAALAKFEEETAAAPVAGAPVAAPQMSKVEMAQAKAKVITKAREEARAQGMSTEDEKKFVAEKLKEFSAQQEAAAATPAPPAAAPKAAMSKVELAQTKAKVITKARDEARAQGMAQEDERKYVAEALRKFSEENQ